MDDPAVAMGAAERTGQTVQAKARIRVLIASTASGGSFCVGVLGRELGLP